MSDEWTEYEIERTRRMYNEKSYLPRNGKVFFKKKDRTRGFIYEAEISVGELLLRPLKESHTFTEYNSIEAIIEAGWVVE